MTLKKTNKLYNKAVVTDRKGEENRYGRISLNEQIDARFFTAVVGGGPAGLFAARELANRGIYSIIFNRDIKPGGLAEYGIYPTKLRMKEGLRNQFRQILARDEIGYVGNVLIGERGDLTLDDLRSLGFQAILITVGAQSTKRLGIPGEDLIGVYHAKDIVYHYNLLPPYSELTYQIGKRVAVIGVGNVMIDVAHWLIEEKQVEQVVAVARRGPSEVKFDRKELEEIVRCIDIEELEAELARVGAAVEAIGQDPMALLRMIREIADKMPSDQCNSGLCIRFLSTPVGITGDERGRVNGLQVEENRLVLTGDGQVKAVGTGTVDMLPVDTVIFAIGDVVDSTMGLPSYHGEYQKNPQPRFPVDGTSYELYDMAQNRPVPDVFLAGWARQPSVGLVGVARKDGVNAARAVAGYLNTRVPSSEVVLERVRDRVLLLGKPVVDKQALGRLIELEQERARALNVMSYKFATNQEMLQVLDLV